MAKRNRFGQSNVFDKLTVEKLLNELSMPHKLIFAICYYCGCRVSEARQLCAGDIESGQVHFRAEITNGGKHGRSVPIAGELAALLGEVELPANGFLFPSRVKGKPISRQACDQALRNVCELLELEGYSTHSFRRSFATNLDRKGTRLKAIAQLGGWRSLTNLSRYLDVTDAELTEAVELL